MKRHILHVAVVALLALAMAGCGTPSEEPSNAVVLERADAATERGFAALGPDTTFHMLEKTFRPVVATDEFALPETFWVETWVYFGADGSVEDFRSRTYDAQDATHQSSSINTDGDVVIVDPATGAQQVVAGFSSFTAAQLRERIDEAVTQTESAADPGGSADTTTVNGKDAYVTETERASRSTGPSVTRTYIDQTTYFTLRWETIATDADGTETITEAKDNLTFEVLPGNQIPA